MKKKGIILDMATNMGWILREIALNTIRTYNRFSVEKIGAKTIQPIGVEEVFDQENEHVANAKKVGVKFTPERFPNSDRRKQLSIQSRYILC